MADTEEIDLSPDQREVIDKIAFFMSDECTDTELALSGKAGSGKSTIVKYAINEANALSRAYNMVMDDDKKEVRTEYTATTNQAARILEKFVGEKTKTIYSFLGLRVMNDYRTGETHTVKTKETSVKKNSIIIVDEASMIDNQLLKLIKTYTDKCKILYVGDDKQLPPVKYSTCPVFDKIDNQVHLTKVHRQKSKELLKLGDAYRAAVDTLIFPPLPKTGADIEIVDGDTFQNKIAYYFQNPVVNETRILAYTNTRVHQYNAHIKSLHSSKDHHEVGDYVITNNPVFSKKITFPTDSILKITAVADESEEYGITGRQMTLNSLVTIFQPTDYNDVKVLLKQEAKDAKALANWSYYFKVKEFFADLRNVYASTVHKAQGQTYKTVFIDLEDIGTNNKKKDVARMLYVACTRPTDKIYIYGDLPSKFYQKTKQRTF